MPTINVHYFASFREKAGVSQEEINQDFRILSDLYKILEVKYQFALPHNMVQVAVNDEFAQMSDLVIPGSKVVFIPPVAGG